MAQPWIKTAVMTEDGQVFIVATYWNSGVDGYSILLEAYNPAVGSHAALCPHSVPNP